MSHVTRKAWVFISAGEARVYRGNDGYEDNIVTSYDYDGFVPNYRRVQSGDIVFLSNKSSIIGVGLIENIEEWQGSRNFNRCIKCGSSKIQSRVIKTPRYRCNVCPGEFDEPQIEARECSKFRAHYGRTFTGVNKPLFEKSKYVNKGTQQAMRELHLAEAEKTLEKWGVDLSGVARASRGPEEISPDHVDSPVDAPVKDDGSGESVAVIGPGPGLSGPSPVAAGVGSAIPDRQDAGMETDNASTVDADVADTGTATRVTAASTHADLPGMRATPGIDTTPDSRNWISALFRRLWTLVSGGGSRRGTGS
jgi:hypothetical protein